MLLFTMDLCKIANPPQEKVALIDQPFGKKMRNKKDGELYHYTAGRKRGDGFFIL